MRLKPLYQWFMDHLKIRLIDHRPLTKPGFQKLKRVQNLYLKQIIFNGLNKTIEK